MVTQEVAAAARKAKEAKDMVITMFVLLEVVRQVASVMAYLEERQVVHRDVAARNIFVGSSLKRVKVGDFGLSRDLYHSADPVYLARTEQRIPFKWMAPEAIRDLKSTTKTDVWSFGVLCFEIFSLGQVPYGSVNTREMMEFILSGQQLNQPLPACPDQMYALMLKCWSMEPTARPAFADILAHVTLMADRIPLSMLNKPIPKHGDTCAPPSDMATEHSSNLANTLSFNDTRIGLTWDGRGIRMLSVKRKNPLYNSSIADAAMMNDNDDASLDSDDNDTIQTAL